jgi:serine phosphatase RsbU (regulator of sigma subunit)
MLSHTEALMQGPPDIAQRNPHRLIIILALYILAPLLLVLEIPVGIHIARKPVTGLSVRNLQVMRVEPGSPASRLDIQEGDKLLALNGQPLRTMVDFYVQTAGRYDLEPLVYVMARGENTFLRAISPVRPSRQRMIWDYGMSLAGLAFLGMGWLILRQRRDLVARYFFTLCMVFAFFLMDIPNWPSEGYMLLTEFIRDIAHLVLPVVVLRFLIYFPERVNLTPETLRRHRLLWLPAAPLLVMTILAHLFKMDPGSGLVQLLQLLSSIFFLGYIIGGLAIFTRKIFGRDQPARRTKLRLAMLGMLCGFLPFVIGAVLPNISSGGGIAHVEWLAFSLILVPISFGLAIMRYGALDLEYVVRHSLIYATLTLGIVLGFTLVVGLLGHALTRYFQTSSFPIVMMAVIATALVLNPARNRLQSLIDRAFYPSRRATREALEQLSHRLSTVVGEKEAVDQMLQNLHDLYRPQHVALFLGNDRTYRLEGMFSAPDQRINADSVQLPAGATLETILQKTPRPIYAEEIDGLDTAEMTDAATTWLLDVLQVQIIVPLFTNQRLRGFLTFGPKSGGTLYSQLDIANLHNFSIQAAALVEIKRLYQDRIDKERMETELSLARTIQNQLVPTSPLEKNGLYVLGHMDSCREIGGDYFDYFPLDNDHVGFAIADAVGKGVPAALLMSSLRSAFRATAIRHRSPDDVVGRLNRNVCDLAESGQLISFFYGILNTVTGQLDFCNGGMNAPILMRKGQDWLERLRRGGLMLGIDPDRRYAQGSLRMQPGDMLYLYTDGITEEFNDQDQLFGEKRLESLIRNPPNLPVEGLLDRVFTEIDAFSVGDQSDDRTLILLHINEMDASA